MLPDEVEAALRKLGPDGDRVRGTLEREFARYLETTAPERRDRDLVGVAAACSRTSSGRHRSGRAAQFAERLFDPDGPSFAEGLRKARERVETAAAEGKPKG